MAKVIVKPEESLEMALRRFKRKVENEGLLLELKKREFYMSPSVKRKEKSKEAQKRLRYKNK